MGRTSRTRTGRPRHQNAEDAGTNHARILEAARSEFAAKGFRGATMRAIANAAGVDVALVAHYFGNKEGLFAATLELPPGALEALVTAMSAPAGVQGKRLTRAYLTLWEDGSTGRQVSAMARAAFADEQVMRSVEGVLLGATSSPEMAPLLQGRQVGFTLAMAHLLGVAVQRHLLSRMAANALDLDALVDRVAPAVQLLLQTPDA